MTRFSSSANATAAAQMHVPYIVFVDLDFSSGHVRASSGVKQYAFGGNTYLPFGTFGQVSSVKETADLSPEKIDFTLSGVDNSLITTVLAETYHGRSASLYIGYCTDAGDLVDTPGLLWEGRMDTMTIKTDVNTSQVVLTCENRLILWGKSAGWLYSQEHQRLFFSGDNFFDQVNSLASKIAKWGDQSVGYNFYRRPDPGGIPWWNVPLV